jgi:hypothetical protein
VWPQEPSDYPITFTLGNPVAGGVVQGELEAGVSPDILTFSFSSPPQNIQPGFGWSFTGETMVYAYWFATPVKANSFTLWQYFFNGAISSQSDSLGYSIS